MLEAIRVANTAASTVARIALTAAELGYEAILIRHPRPDHATLDPASISSFSGIEVHIGCEIDTESPAQASGLIGTHRPNTPILIVTGGTKSMNNFAVRQERVDVLANPIEDHSNDHVLVKTAKSHGVHLELNLGPVLRSTGGNRVRSIQKLRELWTLIDHYDAPFVVTGGPRSHLELRATRDLAAVGEIIGIDPEAIQAGMQQWGSIIQTNHERLADDYVEPGVHLDKTTEEL